MTPAIEARSLSKQFVLRHNRAASLKVRLLGVFYERQREVLEEFWALKNITLSIGRGESAAIIGRNGSGKSTFLKLVAGVHRPTSGQLLVAADARIGTMIELGVGFHPDLNGTENVYLNAAIHGLSRGEIDAIYPRIVEYSGLQHFMDVAIKNYSSGMHLRLGFAVAANLDPDILLLDEIFAVGDADFQKKCMDTMERFRSNGCTIVFVSHGPAAVRAICQRAFLLDAGELLFGGDVEDGLREYERLLTGAPRRPANMPAAPARAAGAETQVQDATARSGAVLGEWALEFLKREGLEPHHRIVEVGLDVTPGSSPLADFVGAERYGYWQAGAPAIPGFGHADYVIAPSVFKHLPLNTIARIMAIAGLHVPHRCRVYATFFDAPGLQVFSPTARPGGVTTFPELEPYQYSFELLRGVADAIGVRTDRIADSSHPEGESVLVIVRG